MVRNILILKGSLFPPALAAHPQNHILACRALSVPCAHNRNTHTPAPCRAKLHGSVFCVKIVYGLWLPSQTRVLKSLSPVPGGGVATPSSIVFLSDASVCGRWVRQQMQACKPAMPPFGVVWLSTSQCIQQAALPSMQPWLQLHRRQTRCC